MHGRQGIELFVSAHQKSDDVEPFGCARPGEFRADGSGSIAGLPSLAAEELADHYQAERARPASRPAPAPAERDAPSRLLALPLKCER